MKQWTLEERYRVLHHPDEIKEFYETISRSAYRQTYHIQPVTGLSSDPNGFALYDKEWHLFYQWCPWGAVHGLKYWYHVTSKDLITRKNEGIGLAPDRDFDNKGVHSGSAISDGEELYLFYTGNHRDENWVRTPYTCAAKLDKEDGKVLKLPAPLFGPRPDYSEHQRDPKVFYRKEDGFYYIFIGARSLDQKGCVLVYRSEKLLSGWEFMGRLKVRGYEDFAGMWECPCVQTIDGKDVLLFSPQYMKIEGRGNSTNHNIYLVGHLDFESLTFIPEGDYRFLDCGFDFYAAQLASGLQKDDQAVIIGWLGLPDNHYPTEEEDWEGSMSLPREIRLKDGKLIQNPIKGIEDLRAEAFPLENRLPSACEILLDLDSCKRDQEGFSLKLFTKENGEGGFTFVYDPEDKVCKVDKTGMNLRFNQKVGEYLEFPLDCPLSNLRIFIDKSSLEIFINDGEAVFSAHVYPTEEEHFYRVSGEKSMKIWTLKAAVKDDFII